MPSLLPLAIGAIVLAFVGQYALKYYQRRRKALAAGCLPAPHYGGSPFSWFALDTVRTSIAADNEKRFPDLIMERHEEMTQRLGGPNKRYIDTFAINMLNEEMYITCDPKNIQALLATQFKDFGLGDARNGNFAPLLGHGIFASDGQRWEESRALLRPQFVREQVSDLELEEKHVQNLMKHIRPQADKWTDEVDLQPLFFRLTMDSATEFLFGESADSQLADLPGYSAKHVGKLDEKLFAVNFDRSQAYLAKSARFGNLYWTQHNKEFKDINKQIHEFMDHYVQRALSKAASGEKPVSNHDGEKERYVMLDKLALETRNPIEIRDQLLNILLAGRDTTASLLGWFYTFMVQYPAVHAKLRPIILEEFGTYSSPKEISFVGLKNCTYLQQCLNEALRLQPVVPMNSRRAQKDTTLPRGGGPDGTAPVFVKKNTECNYSVHVMHRRKDLWGEDADEFRPERWAGRKPGWEYLPFNGGPRICIGQQFALTEASYVIVRLMQRFDAIEGLNVPKVGDPLRHGLTLTSCPADGVKVRLREAKE